MPRLGALLLRAGAVTEESVNRALAVQGFAGGRLGTLLIERGSASEDDVGNALAEQHGCPYIPWKTLGSLSPAVTAGLPAKFAIRHSAVPVEVGEGFVRIALRDPANLRILDELFFVTGKKILPAVAPEVRLYQALEKYYGERRTPRFAILAEKLSRPIAPSVIKKPLPPPPDFSPVTGPLMPGEPSSMSFDREEDGELLTPLWKVPDHPTVGWAGLPPAPRDIDEEPESIPWEEMPNAPGSWRAAAPAPPAPRPPPIPQTSLPPAAKPAPGRPAAKPQPPDFSNVFAAHGRDEIFEAALGALARRFRKAAVFAVRADGVVGWAGSGEFVQTEALRSLELPWAEPSIFLNVRMSRAFYLGPLPPLPRHGPLADALGGWPAECLVQPVLMREKTVAFFYVECWSAQGATPADLAHVRELAGATAAALAASIRLKKKEVI
jgi:hypothetical protein